jgi:hypothetical protein
MNKHCFLSVDLGRTLLVCGVLALVPLVFAPSQANAQDNMFKCTMTDGRVEYTNRPPADERNCTRLNIEPSVVLPAPTALPRPPAAPPAAAPARPAPSASSPAPAGFPRVDAPTQRARDTDRKRILEEELRAQEARYAELAKAYSNGQPERQGDERNYQRYVDRVQRMKDDLDRVQGDINSVKSELGKLQ